MPRYRVTEATDPGSQAPPVYTEYHVTAQSLRLAVMYALRKLHTYTIAVTVEGAEAPRTH